MLRKSFICKEINVNANKKDNKQSKWCNIWVTLIRYIQPKDIPLLDRRTVLVKVNSLGSDKYKPSSIQIKVHIVWINDQKNVIKNRLSEKINIQNTTKNISIKIS